MINYTIRFIAGKLIKILRNRINFKQNTAAALLPHDPEVAGSNPSDKCLALSFIRDALHLLLFYLLDVCLKCVQLLEAFYIFPATNVFSFTNQASSDINLSLDGSTCPR